MKNRKTNRMKERKKKANEISFDKSMKMKGYMEYKSGCDIKIIDK